MNGRVVHWAEAGQAQQRSLLERPAVRDDAGISRAVRQIIARVRADGDAALAQLTAELDGAELDTFRVSPAEFDAAERALSRDAHAAIDLAIGNVRRFHAAQLPADISLETMPGVCCERIGRAIDTVGLYVPAGSAPLPSAAIMLTVPAD
ncbi:MAG TPA: histidinol dehydrogenase, partial [Woeseiaceae bacterium]|nr:histidinol dehydrogenase [Woeseiaceae bacterium]